MKHIKIFAWEEWVSESTDWRNCIWIETCPHSPFPTYISDIIDGNTLIELNGKLLRCFYHPSTQKLCNKWHLYKIFVSLYILYISYWRRLSRTVNLLLFLVSKRYLSLCVIKILHPMKYVFIKVLLLIYDLPCIMYVIHQGCDSIFYRLVISGVF